jgi:hypothetical protein
MADLTLRQWLAGQALALTAHIPERDPRDIAQKAVAIADAVIARLKETAPTEHPGAAVRLRWDRE